jgi:hypothetical protein
MRRAPVHRRFTFAATTYPARSGASSIEVLVAFTLLSTALSCMLPLVVRHGRLLESCRHYRLALDELSNQLDSLTALPPAEAKFAVAQLMPSQFIAAKLPGAKLTGQLKAADVGDRLILQLSWNDIPEHATSVTMAAWILPMTQNPPPESGGAQP